MNGNDSEININIICRICLETDLTLLSLFDNDIANMLNFCDFWKVIKGDGFPEKICESCRNLILQSYKLKQLCDSSKLYLKSFLDKPKNLLYNTEKTTNIKKSNIKCDVLKEGARTFKNLPANDVEFLYVCIKCDYSFSDVDSLNKHSCHHRNKEDETIGRLTYETYNAVPQLERAKVDISEKYYKQKEDVLYHCRKCKEQFEFEKDALIHESVHTKDLLCMGCKKSFPTLKILRRHIKTHMIAKSHICKVCNKGFCESTALTKHIRLHHMGIPREKKYCCRQCGKRFTDKYYLTLHTRKHTGEKPLICHICDKSFYDPRSLKVHLMVHMGNKPYLCSYCGNSFVQSSHLKKHLVVHTHDKLHTCNICNKCFTQSSSLRRHKKLHSDKDKFKKDAI